MRKDQRFLRVLSKDLQGKLKPQISLDWDWNWGHDSEMFT